MRSLALRVIVSRRNPKPNSPPSRARAITGNCSRCTESLSATVASLEDERNQIKAAWTKVSDDSEFYRILSQKDAEFKIFRELQRAKSDGTHGGAEFYNLQAEHETLKTELSNLKVLMRDRD